MAEKRPKIDASGTCRTPNSTRRSPRVVFANLDIAAAAVKPTRARQVTRRCGSSFRARAYAREVRIINGCCLHDHSENPGPEEAISRPERERKKARSGAIRGSGLWIQARAERITKTPRYPGPGCALGSGTPGARVCTRPSWDPGYTGPRIYHGMQVYPGRG